MICDEGERKTNMKACESKHAVKVSWVIGMLFLFASNGLGYSYELVLQDGRILDVVTYREEGDRIHFKLDQKGKRYVIDKSAVVRIDARRLAPRQHAPDEGTTLYLSDGRIVDVDTCWETGGDIRFKKAGVNKTYRVDKKRITRIVGECGSERKDDDTSLDSEKREMAYDASYTRKEQLITKIKEYRNVIEREKAILGNLKRNARAVKRKPLSVLRKEFYQDRSTSCFKTKSADIDCKRASTPQQYRNYVLREMVQDIGDREYRLQVLEHKLAQAEKALASLL